MYRVPNRLALLAAAAVLVVSGCKESPTAPDSSAPPAPTVMTPVSAKITSITVTKFPAKKTDGSDWDLSILSDDRRPDLYVVLKADNVAADYTSPTFTNALSPGHSYVFDQGLPVTIPYDNSRRLYVMDEDFGSADDRLGWVTLNLPAAYRGDNGTILNYSYTDSSGRITVLIRGTWIY